MKRLSDQTLYEIIEVSVEAAPEEIARACDRAAATYGPGSLVTYTLASAEESALLASRIEEARAVLLDPSARSRYDERIGVRPPAPSFTPPPVPAHTPVPEPRHEAPTATPTTWPAPLAPSAPSAEPVAAEPLHVSPGLPLVAAAEGLGPAEPPPAPSAPVAPQTAPRQTDPVGAGQGTLPGLAGPVPIPLTVPVAAPLVLQGPPSPILLEKEVAPPPPPAIPEGAPWSGELLRRVRESRGLTIPLLAERTRITRHHLENIEQDRWKALPAPVYLRGIIMSLARELRLDGQKVARSYLERMGAGSDAEPKQ